MKPQHINLLCDPWTREELKLVDGEFDGDEIVKGKLVGKYEYPIVNGIPRFVEDEGYSDNFGYQWNRWARIQFEDENIDKPMSGYTTAMFDKVTKHKMTRLDGKIVLDIGCGPGRFVDVASKRGGVLVCLDYSSAIDAAKKNFEGVPGERLFVQGDALRLPIKDDVIDYAYSIGVLHHTPSPSRGVKEAARVLKKKGFFALSVYRKGGYYDFVIVNLWRKLFKMLRPKFGNKPALYYSYITGTIAYILARVWPPLAMPFRVIFSSVALPDLRWSILDTFDSITPSYQSSHETHEVYDWFEAADFVEIKPGQWGTTNFIGKKK